MFYHSTKAPITCELYLVLNDSVSLWMYSELRASQFSPHSEIVEKILIIWINISGKYLSERGNICPNENCNPQELYQMYHVWYIWYMSCGMYHSFGLFISVCHCIRRLYWPYLNPIVFCFKRSFSALTTMHWMIDVYIYGVFSVLHAISFCSFVYCTQVSNAVLNTWHTLISYIRKSEWN